VGRAETVFSEGDCSGADAVIFVTVGTDHHPFDRLLKAVDSLKAEGIISEEVFIQSGSSDYRPEHCSFERLLPFDSLMAKIVDARIVITHGGPGSIMPAIYGKKIPVVMPRRKQFGEVVDDHQVDFAKRLEEQNMVFLAETKEDLQKIILDYDVLAAKTKAGPVAKNHQQRLFQFTIKLDELCHKLTAGEKIR